MLNINAPGNEPYKSADIPSGFTFVEKVNFCIKVIIDTLRFLLLSIPIYLKLIKNVVIKPDKKSICGWNALVTGGANGIGKAIAKELCKEGCNVAIVDIDEKAAEVTAQELEKEFKVKTVSYRVDISNSKLIPVLEKHVENDLGPIDVLINNAGLLPLLSLREGTDEDVERIVAVNMTSQFFTVRTFLKGMIERKRGHIVSVCSLSSRVPFAGGIIYTATKYAIDGFTRALEQELREEGRSKEIQCTSIHPFFVASRQDLMDSLNLSIPALTPKEVGKRTVEAILNNSRIVIIPNYFKFVLKLYDMFPYEVQNLWRDHVFRLKEVKLIKNPENCVLTKKYN